MHSSFVAYTLRLQLKEKVCESKFFNALAHQLTYGSVRNIHSHMSYNDDQDSYGGGRGEERGEGRGEGRHHGQAEGYYNESDNQMSGQQSGGYGGGEERRRPQQQDDSYGGQQQSGGYAGGRQDDNYGSGQQSGGYGGQQEEGRRPHRQEGNDGYSGGGGGTSYGGGNDEYAGAHAAAQQHAGSSGNADMFSSVLGMLGGQKQHLANQDVDEQGMVQAHQSMYGDGGGSGQAASSGGMGGKSFWSP